MNIGPSKSFKLCKEHVGGYQNVGATKQDFKNFRRDLIAYIKDTDAQMFVDILTKKKEVSNAFFFEYDVDSDGSLCRALWCDVVSRKNYFAFGDMISFDTTFKTNRYV